MEDEWSQWARSHGSSVLFVCVCVYVCVWMQIWRCGVQGMVVVVRGWWGEERGGMRGPPWDQSQMARRYCEGPK